MTADARRVDLFSVGTVRVAIDLSWLLVFALVSASLALGYLPGRHPGHGSLAYWGAGVGIALLFFGSILLHELSHAWVSNGLGVRVQRITLFVFGGLAHLETEPHDPETDFRIAIAGPLASFLLAAIFGLLALALGDDASLAAGAVQYLTSLS